MKNGVRQHMGFNSEGIRITLFLSAVILYIDIPSNINGIFSEITTFSYHKLRTLSTIYALLTLLVHAAAILEVEVIFDAGEWTGVV